MHEYLVLFYSKKRLAALHYSFVIVINVPSGKLLSARISRHHIKSFCLSEIAIWIHWPFTITISRKRPF